MRFRLAILPALACLLFCVAAGDSKDVKDAPPPKPKPTEQSAEGVEVPPAPPLSPEDSMATFKLQPGFAVELVASEPLVGDPVAIAFDADGRIWAVEMRGYMPDAFCFNEQDSVGRIVVLEDTYGYGRMDHSNVFHDRLVLLLAVPPLRYGPMVAASA